MLFGSTVLWFLLGLSGTAFTSLFAAIGTQSRPKHMTLPLHALLAAAYIPLILVAVNAIPPKLMAPSWAAWFVLGLAVFGATTTHSLIAVGYRLVVAQKVRDAAVGPAPSKLVSRELPQRCHPAYVMINASVADYREAVASAEQAGRDFAFVQRRIAPYLNSDEMLRFIATHRFGAGNAEMNAYVSSHQRRRQAFFACLDSGARYREMFPREAILSYVQTGTHAEEMWPLAPATVVDLLKNWRQTLLQYPNYHVGISDHHLPIKYHLIDGECVILHEPVGKGDDFRLNSVFVYGQQIGGMVAKDFDLVWGLIDPEWRDRQKIARWIKDELIPLARRR